MEKSLKRIHEGLQAFHDEHYKGNNASKMKQLAEFGQNPEYFFISCSDSRYDPQQLSTITPGDAFKSQHIAALVPPHGTVEATTIAGSIEFAVDVLRVKHIIIMGHTDCGGVKALVTGECDGNIKKWLSTAESVLDTIDRSKDVPHQCTATEHKSVIWSLQNLRNYPCVKKAIEENRLMLHGWCFDLKNGQVEAYDENLDKFMPFFSAEDSAKRA